MVMKHMSYYRMKSNEIVVEMKMYHTKFVSCVSENNNCFIVDSIIYPWKTMIAF